MVRQYPPVKDCVTMKKDATERRNNMNLNEQQQQVVNELSQSDFTHAPAGTSKTRVWQQGSPYHSPKEGQGSEILCLTFTNRPVRN